MDVTARLTVFFEDPFWVGVYERRAGPLLEAAKVTFGKEPTDGQVYEFFLSHFSRLRFGAVLAPQSQPQRRPNPKRAQREAARAPSFPRGGHQGPAGRQRPAGGSRQVTAGFAAGTCFGGKGTPVCPAHPEAQGKTQGPVAPGVRVEGKPSARDCVQTAFVSFSNRAMSPSFSARESFLTAHSLRRAAALSGTCSQ